MAAPAALVDIAGLIAMDPDYREGRPFIKGTGVTVQRIGVLCKQGLAVEQIDEDVFDGYLSLAQIHAALACYHANRTAIDADLAVQDEENDRAAAAFYARRDGR